MFSSQEELDEPLAFTDLVLGLYLESLPSHSHGDEEQFFDAEPLADAVVGAFALGCAIGLEYPDRILTILEQTHPGSVDEIIAECRVALSEQVAEAKAAGQPLESDDFVDSLVEALEQGDHVDMETAQNALSMSLEYGLVLAHVERPAAIVVRNAFNRDQEEAVGEFEAGDSADMPAGPSPYMPLQDLAREIVTAYEADVGFWP